MIEGGSLKSPFERMVAGEPYRADDPQIIEANVRAMDLAEQFNRSRVSDEVRRDALLHELLGSLGTGTVIRAPFHCDYGFQIHIGRRCFINFGLIALDVATITIGDDVQIGPNVQLLTPTHPIDPEERRDKLEAASPIAIGDNVWLGGGVIVLPGVSIGDDTVVGAGSVVSRDLPPGVVAVGNPARVIREVR